MPILQNTNIDWKLKTQPESTSCLSTKGCQWPSGKVSKNYFSLNYYCKIFVNIYR